MKIISLNILVFLIFHFSGASDQYTNVGYINDLLLEYIQEQCSNSFDFFNISRGCAWQLGALCYKPEILVTMLDASSKYPYTGHLYSTRLDFGNFDECISIDYLYEGKKILGKYCAIGYVVPDFKDVQNVEGLYKLSLCIPDQCSSEDYADLINQFLNTFNITFSGVTEVVEVLNDLCSTKDTDTDLTSGTIIVMTIFAIWITIMTLSTIYDIFLYKNKIECKNKNFIAFSVFTNGRKLLQIHEHSHGRIQILDGLRSISIIWIISGHGFSSWFGFIPAMNREDVDSYIRKRQSAYVDGAHLGVDTFFFMSGFLFAYHYLKFKPKNLFVQLKSIPLLYFHRLLRIMPSVLMIFLFAVWIFPKVGSGPLWHFGTTSQLNSCKKHWWSYFLFVQNYVNYDDLCIVPMWYISADMQMSLLAPIILIPLTFVLKRPFGVQLSIIILSILSMFCIGMTIAISLIFRNYNNAFDTHSRLIDYFIGIMMGIFMRQKKDTPFLKMVERNQLKIINFLIWLVILTGMVAILLFYQEVDAYHEYLSKSVYFSLYKPGWCIGICWIIYSCYHGYGGFVNWILTRPVFQIIAKLSYAMYITHFIVIAHYVLSNRSKLYFSDYQEFYLFCGYFVETMVVSFLWTLAFESPLISIEKSIFGKQSTEIGPKQESVVGVNENRYDKSTMTTN